MVQGRFMQTKATSMFFSASYFGYGPGVAHNVAAPFIVTELARRGPRFSCKRPRR
jgi:hypothetical protein